MASPDRRNHLRTELPQIARAIIQHHQPAVVAVHMVSVVARVLAVVRVPAIDAERGHPRRPGRLRPGLAVGIGRVLGEVRAISLASCPSPWPHSLRPSPPFSARVQNEDGRAKPDHNSQPNTLAGTVNLCGCGRDNGRGSGWAHGRLCQSGNPLVTSAKVRKAWVRAARYWTAETWSRRRWKRSLIPTWAERKRWAWPANVNRSPATRPGPTPRAG